MPSKTLKVISWTILIFACLTGLYFCGVKSMFSGETTTEQKWSTDDYDILFVKDQGWAGGPAYRYELHKKYFIPILSRKVESISGEDTVNVSECILYFPVTKISFDKCVGQLK